MTSLQLANPWLSDEELIDVTHRRKPSAQARALAHLGVPHRRRPDGTVLVSRAAVDAALQGPIVNHHSAANGLNWSIGR
jgi:hypothetical protein